MHAVPPPDGVVTFVFTDIEASTRLLRQLGEDYAVVLDTHRTLLRSAWAAHGGYEVDSSGDAFFVAFAGAAPALAACAQAQHALAEWTWPSGASVRVRMGVHTGLAAPRDGRYVAFAVHQGARIASTAHGGQVVVSETTARAAEGGPALLELGRFRVRDFDRPVRLFQLGAESFPAPRALPATHHNLPTPPTRLIGRAGDLDRLVGLLDAARTVTVVGTGGVGKTRLVTELGLTTARRWPDGVWLVDCSPLDDAALLPAAVATVLGVTTTADQPLGPALAERLADSRALIVLDACERHLAAARELAEQLLAAGPRVQVLATSTEPLRAAGETLLRLGPLPAGDARSPAVELFAERARAVDGTFALEASADVVVEVCRRLDGLPLGLEIAAARASVLHPEEILAGLDQRFQLLRARDAARPARQHTMAALLDWSFRLLAPDEQLVLRRLALFAGSFDLDAVAPAVGADLDPDDVPEVVWSLADKSLLSTDRAAGRTRYRALETVRSYAREQLDDHGETEAVARRLAGFWTARLGPQHRTDRAWMHDVGLDLDNLRAVLRPARAQELATTVARHHDARQTFREGIAEVGGLVGVLTEPTPARVGLLTALGDLLARTGDADAAAARGHEAAQLRAEVGAPAWDEVGVEKLLGDAALRAGAPERTIALARTALATPLSVRGRARMQNMLGIALATAGQDTAAAAAFAAELAAAGQAADDVLLVHAHGNSAEIRLRLGDLAQAALHQRTCLDLAVTLGQTGMVALALLGSAQIGVEAEDDWPDAVRLVAKARDLERLTQMDLYRTDREQLGAFLARAREVLGGPGLAEAEAAGTGMSAEDALALARSLLAGVSGAMSGVGGTNGEGSS